MLSLDFVKRRFLRGTFCAFIDVSQETIDFPVEEHSYRTLVEDDSVGRVYLELRINWPSSTEVHLHLEIESEFDEPNPDTLESLENISAVISKFHGLPTRVKTTTAMLASVDELPEHGFVNMLLGIDAETDNSILNLDGASFEVTSEDGLLHLRWILLEDEKLWVSTIGFVEIEISNDYLDNCYSVALDALAKFILEVGPDDDKTERDNLRDKQTA